MAAQEGPKSSVGCSSAPPLPLEVFALITSALSMQDKFILMRVCKQWRAHLQSRICWQEILVANAKETEGTPRKAMPLSALRKVLRFSDNSVQRVQFVQMPSQDILLALQELVTTNSHSLSVLHIHLNPSSFEDEQDELRAYLRACGGSLEEPRSVALRDRLILIFLFGKATLNTLDGTTFGPCTNLRELSISRCGPEIVSWRVTLPPCLKTLVLESPDDAFGSEPGLWYNLRMKTSLTKLIMRHSGPHKAIVYFNQILAAAPDLQSLSLQGFEFGTHLDPFEVMPGRFTYPEGVYLLQHLQELNMHDCVYELNGALPPQLRSLRITDCELARQSMQDWKFSRLKHLEKIQFEQVRDFDELEYFDSAKFVHYLVKTSMVGETGPYWNPDCDWRLEDRAIVPLRSLWLASRPCEGGSMDTSLDDTLPYILHYYGQNLTELQVTGPWRYTSGCSMYNDDDDDDEGIIFRLLRECRQLESLTFREVLDIGELAPQMATIEESIQKYDNNWAEDSRRKYGRDYRFILKLKELRLWDCPAERSDMEALKGECTARGIRFEWLPEDRNADGQRQVPVYNWRPADDSNMWLFDSSKHEVLDEPVITHSPLPSA